MKRILITGAAGKIGSVLQFFAPAGARYGRVPVPASSSEPREIHTVMVPPRWAGGTYTPSLPALAPHSATRAAVRRNAAAASAEAGGGTDGATCGSRADATGGSRAGAVAAGCRPPRVRCQYRLWQHRTDGTGASALQEGHLRGLPRSRRSTRAKLSNWQRRKQRRIVRSESR